MIKNSCVNACSPCVKRNVFEAYSSIYGLCLLDERQMKKLGPALRYLALCIFKKEAQILMNVKKMKFVRNRDLFKLLPFQLNIKQLFTVAEQWRFSSIFSIAPSLLYSPA